MKEITFARMGRLLWWLHFRLDNPVLRLDGKTRFVISDIMRIGNKKYCWTYIVTEDQLSYTDDLRLLAERILRKRRSDLEDFNREIKLSKQGAS